MKKITLVIAAVIALIGVTTFVPEYVGASPASEIKDGVDKAGGTTSGDDLPTRIKTIVNTMLFILGSIAVIMIVIGGIRYVVSNGESSHIKSAKDTILYAIIGLIVAILAYAIVNFVVDQFI